MWGNARLVGAFITLTIISIMYIFSNEEHRQALFGLQGRFIYAVARTEETSKYLVYGKQCKIENLNPFDRSIMQFIEPTTPVICSTLPPLTRIERRDERLFLVIDQMLVSKYKLYKSHTIQCCYAALTRVSQSLDNYNTNADRKYKTGNCKNFVKEERLKDSIEFIFVKCKSVNKKRKQGKFVYQNAHAVVQITPKIRQKLNVSQKLPRLDSNSTLASERLNVLIIGIDSVSRLSLRRTMPGSVQYFENNGWIELSGYNKTNDNTLPNVMAILAGLRTEEMFKKCYNEKIPIMDNCPFLWRDFAQKGYITAYAEDIASLSTFNYRMNGFVQQPTDFYMRPFMIALHDLLPYKNKDSLPICYGPEDAAHHIFTYAKDFSTTFKEHNYFGLFWLNSFSHNNVNSPGALDSRLVNLLKELDDSGVYKNSVVLVLSDHGIRFGSIRKTLMGYLEERLPFIFMHIPSGMAEKYPDFLKNLIINQNRLTSPYDVHAMLSELLGDFPKPPKSCPTCRSLFHEVPKDRSCSEAGIDPHWCVCSDFLELLPNDTFAVNVGKFLLERINNKTKILAQLEKLDDDLCLVRTFERFLRVHEKKSNVDGNKRTYVVVMETKPHGLFEATIQLETTPMGPKYTVLGFISRLDSYQAVSKCVTTKNLQFYCHCLGAE